LQSLQDRKKETPTQNTQSQTQNTQSQSQPSSYDMPPAPPASSATDTQGSSLSEFSIQSAPALIPTASAREKPPSVHLTPAELAAKLAAKRKLDVDSDRPESRKRARR
jgi:hypothetical protein